ncbi:Oxidoreductase family, NAD-binding Rossmann fold [Streptomyces sp. TLI_053]|uniref:Gfo/Idh/MocA family oxidoreductase n=1 Tax=Streptomyces sp. TLI_053 TaxID=1855352 RepID=UPI0008798911|nr:Gfo/Idh/MocA family oxidoreductase [Streptomyces sp. TLI_053]SDT83418.1 Oxidoreductase family, NAD-binding Rossmann fold [Streptomyces sp. TLI_053]
MSTPVNVLVVGVGPHTRLNHLPALAAAQDAGLAGTVTGVNLPHAAAPVDYGTPGQPRRMPIVAVQPLPARCRTLPGPVLRVLEEAVERERVGAIVVASEPSVHLPYALWAIERGLPLLLDKPLTVHPGASTDPAAAQAIADDFDTLLDAYRTAQQRDPRMVVSVLAQRRWHPAFRQARELIAEVAEATNCPVTSIQSSHGDGQWRLPDELVDLGYHGFRDGYGKAAHSGYHHFDIVPWWLAASERPGKELDEIEVHAVCTRPADFLTQLTVADHARVLPGFADRNPYSEQDLHRLTANFGEVDVHLNVAYRGHGRVLALGSHSLAHTTFSQRAVLDPVPGSLYKGNGRIGQESHIVQQGPFQALHLHVLQTLHGDGEGVDPRAAGGADHIELHVFRNDRLNLGWERHRRLGFDDLTRGTGPGAVLPTQRSARTCAVTEFLSCLAGRTPRAELASDLADHRRPARLMAAAYLSMARRWAAGDRPTAPAVLDFHPSTVPGPVPAAVLAPTGRGGRELAASGAER